MKVKKRPVKPLVCVQQAAQTIRDARKASIEKLENALGNYNMGLKTPGEYMAEVMEISSNYFFIEFEAIKSYGETDCEREYLFGYIQCLENHNL